MKAARQQIQEEMELMAFAPIETRAPNPEAWLVHAFMWLQPELALSPPPSSGLRITHREELPTPAFAPLLMAIPRPSTNPMWGGPPDLRATATSRPPASDLQPLRPLL